MKPQLNQFLKYHQQLETTPIESWAGNLFLPPCTCYTSGYCAQSSSTSPFDFSSHEDIVVKDLVDLCHYVDSNVTSTTQRSLHLCKKYSPSNLTQSLPNSTSLTIDHVLHSKEYKEKEALLQNDLKLLFPLSRAIYTFKRRKQKSNIKIQICCNMSRCYKKGKVKEIKTKPRNCSTLKPISKQDSCPFFINIFFDIYKLVWFTKWNGQTMHQHHKPKKHEEFMLGQHQLSNSMITEINKLQKACASSSIQQNILMSNNNISLTIQTIINKRNAQSIESLSNYTDAEQLLQALKEQSNITYFAMYAESAHTPLLTISKVQRARVENNNNIQLSGYLSGYKNGDGTPFIPTLDSALQKTVQELLVKNSKDHQVKVLLSVGWARDEDLRLLRKFPEVLKMDCTFKTNREGRPLFNLVSKDSNNKLSTILRCLLPSEKAAIFDTILGTIVPKILGEKTCSNIKMVITDGDSQEIQACIKACRSVFKNAQHITCLWHLIHNAVMKNTIFRHKQLKNIIKHWL
jgi:hypothetical protein